MSRKKFSFFSKKTFSSFLFSLFWFVIGFIIAGITIVSIILVYFRLVYKDKVYPGIIVENVYVGKKTKAEVKKIFDEKNRLIEKSAITFIYQDKVATVSAKDLDMGYDSQLIAEQTYGLGKSSNMLSNMYIALTSYLNGIILSTPYSFSDEKFKDIISPIQQTAQIDPVDALFSVENGRVIAFRQSSDGQTIDFEKLNENIEKKIPEIVREQKTASSTFYIPIKKLRAKIATDKANNLGIVEVIGRGSSFYRGSIPNRVYNITLATSRVNGVLIAPGETFSFNDSIGDVSKYTGYREAYIIKDGRTILGDGGGVCQVSTTLFRAILNSGLPIIERHPHSYRVGYYEQGFPPGLDATVYYPTDDLKFKNDTSNHILIQSSINPIAMELIFTLYGKGDNREVSISTPVITSQSPPPPPLYQDDPTLQRGITKQVDFEAPGANVVFSRTVKKDGKIIISEKFSSNYIPWRAIFLKGTKD